MANNTKETIGKYKYKRQFPKLSLVNISGTIFLVFLAINFFTSWMVLANIVGGTPCNESLLSVKASMFDLPKFYGNVCDAEGNLVTLMVVMGVCALCLYWVKKERGDWY